MMMISRFEVTTQWFELTRESAVIACPPIQLDSELQLRFSIGTFPGTFKFLAMSPENDPTALKGGGDLTKSAVALVPIYRRPTIPSTKDTKTFSQGTQNTAKKAAQRAKAPKFGQFTRFPLDVIFEIFQHTNPISLLQLSRVSKSFRAILNPHVNRYIWAAARSNIEGLPGCPPDLNEAQYARLMFENSCYACGKSAHPTAVDYGLRLRLCKPCAADYVIGGPMFNIPREISSRVFFWSLIPRSSRNLLLGFDKWMVRHLSKQVEANEECHSYFRLEVEAMVDHCVALLQLDDSKHFELFVSERQALIRQVNESSYDMAKFHLESAQGRKQAKASVTITRKGLIEEKLKAMGCSKDDFPQSFDGRSIWKRWKELVYKSQPLTDRVWSNIEGKLFSLIDEAAKHRKTYKFNRIP